MRGKKWKNSEFCPYFPSHHEIYTINDSQESIENFAQELSQYLPLLESYDQSTIDKLMRKLKI